MHRQSYPDRLLAQKGWALRYNGSQPTVLPWKEKERSDKCHNRPASGADDRHGSRKWNDLPHGDEKLSPRRMAWATKSAPMLELPSSSYCYSLLIANSWIGHEDMYLKQKTQIPILNMCYGIGFYLYISIWDPLAELMASSLCPNRDQDRNLVVPGPYHLRSKFG